MSTVRLTKTAKRAGCAAKHPPGYLLPLLQNLPAVTDPRVLIGATTADDAAVIALDADRALVLTTDFFTPIVDDPFEFGQVAAANALSDVYAMGGRPISALGIVGFPDADLPVEVLSEILRGGAMKAKEAGIDVVGGHTIKTDEPIYGLAVVGEVHPSRILSNAGARPGDALVLTKPLGTGIITTALKQRRATQESVDAAVTSMTTLNGTASRIMRNFAVHACSDVTGFALLGHSQEMAAGSEVTIVLESMLLPLLPGAAQLAEEGHLTGGCRRNRAYLQDKVVVDPSVGAGLVEIGFDPQTSGGLLIALPRADAPRLVAELHASGVSAATIVGHATSYQGTRVKLM